MVPTARHGIAGDGIHAVKLESDCSKALTSACLRSHRGDVLWQPRKAAVWLTPKSCANEMKPKGVSVDRTWVIGPSSRVLKNNRESGLKWIPVLCWENNQHGCSGGGIKITNSSIIIKVTLIKISPCTLEKLVLSDWSPVLQLRVWLGAVLRSFWQLA